MAKRKELKPLENFGSGTIWFIHTPRSYEASAPPISVTDVGEGTEAQLEGDSKKSRRRGRAGAQGRKKR